MAFEFDPRKYSKAALALIMVRAQEWGISPAEAAARILNELAKKTEEPKQEEVPA